MIPVVEEKRSYRRVSDVEETKPSSKSEVFYKTWEIDTQQQNLEDLDPRLKEHLTPADFFYIRDLTADLTQWVKECGVKDGFVVVQILHTSATLCVNELDEPMLLMDMAKKLRWFAPKEDAYFHNGPLRTVNLCAEDTHCDRNGDAHVKAALFGNPSVSLIVRDGNLVLGRWQKISLIEFDGPRKREVLAQVMGIS
jgi:secondary thiamine-phosphate synthase enzyme